MLQYLLQFWISVVPKRSATLAVSIGHLQKILKTNLLVKSNTSTANFRPDGAAYGDFVPSQGYLSPITFGEYINGQLISVWLCCLKFSNFLIIIKCTYNHMICSLFRFWVRNSSNFWVGFLESLRHKKVIPRLTDL